MASYVARHVLEYLGDKCDYVTLKASKYSALVCAEAPEVEITRSLKDGSLVPAFSGGIVYATSTAPASRVTKPPSTSSSTSIGLSASDESKHLAAIAIGSNLGDRFSSIELALRLLEIRGVHYNRLPDDAEVSVVDTSFMYETEPMYVTDQPKFINCACLVRSLSTFPPLHIAHVS